MKNLKNNILLSLFTVAVLCVSAFKAGAQGVEFGIRFMPTFSSFNIKTSSGGNVKGEATLGYGVGALLGINLTHHVGIQGEVIYSSIAQKYKEQDRERKINLKYVNIPVLLSLNTGKTKAINLNIVAGPQIGVSVGSRITGTSSDSTQAILSVKKGDLGFAYGVGLDFGLNPSRTVRLGVGFRGVYGLVDISDHSGTITTDSYYVLDRTHVKANAAYIGFSFIF